MTELQVVPIEAVKAVVDLLAELGVTPTHMQVDANKVLDPRPLVRIWTRLRTEFEQVSKAIGAEAVPGRYYNDNTARDYVAHLNTETARIQIACTSRAHQHDFEPKDGAL